MIICRLEVCLFRSVSIVTVMSKYYLHLTVTVHTTCNKVMSSSITIIKVTLLKLA